MQAIGQHEQHATEPERQSEPLPRRDAFAEQRREHCGGQRHRTDDERGHADLRAPLHAEIHRAELEG